MISRAAFAETCRKQIKVKNEQTLGNDTSHQRLNDLLSNCSISLACFLFFECVEISYAQ